MSAAARKAIQAQHAEWRAEREARGWVFHEELRLEGRLPLTAGRMFRIRGSRYWFRFSSGQTTPDGRIEVLCSGPYTKAGSAIQHNQRAFWSDRVTKVARATTSLKEAA